MYAETEDLADSEPQSVLVQAKYLLSWMAYRAPTRFVDPLGRHLGPISGWVSLVTLCSQPSSVSLEQKQRSSTRSALTR